MPSPFPGMDPFLEDPKFFGDLHGTFQTYMREQLQSRLPAPYFAAISERLVVEVEEAKPRWIESDTDILRSYRDDDSDGGVAVMTKKTSFHTRTEPIIVSENEPETQKFVEIRTRDEAGEERVITSIEVLSPSNKRLGPGRDLYLKKQREVREAGISLIEIDLLRDGEHTTAVSKYALSLRRQQPDYHVHVAIANNHESLLYPFRLDDLLPEVAVPLLSQDGYVALDLQMVFTRCYDSGPYPRRVRYELPLLIPPLKPEQQTWATKLLEPKHAPQNMPLSPTNPPTLDSLP